MSAEPINLAEIEKRAHQCSRMGIGLLLDSADVARLVVALRDGHSRLQAKRWPEGNNWLVDHGITDEAHP